MIVPPIPSTPAVSDATAPDGVLSVVLGLCLFATLIGLYMFGRAVMALWHGQRVAGLAPTTVASLTKGRVVLSGLVEPAWAVAPSPFGSKEPCVWYDVSSAISGYRYYLPVFHQRNAVPFVLNDGTGRVLVLGRRARWDSGGGMGPGSIRGPELLELLSGAETSPLLDRPLQPAPPFLKSWRMPFLSDAQIEQHMDEYGSVLVGQQVTVIGRAIPYASSAIKRKDACVDGGQSLGLTGTYVVGTAAFTGLDVLGGSPDSVMARGRANVVLGALGLVIIVIAVATFVALVTA